jgi:hypothetical protein
MMPVNQSLILEDRGIEEHVPRGLRDQVPNERPRADFRQGRVSTTPCSSRRRTCWDRVDTQFAPPVTAARTTRARPQLIGCDAA